MDRALASAYAAGMAQGSKREAEEAEAVRELGRLEREGDLLGRSALGRATRRAREHFSAADAQSENDPIELWGRRIGRALSLIGFVALAIYLYATYVR